MELFTIIFWIGLCTLIGYLIGQKKDAVGGCIVLSIFLGPIGWLIGALMEGNVRKCPFCAENCKPEALVCPHCQRDIPKIEAPKPTPAPTLQPVASPHAPDEDEKTKGMRAIVICIGVVIVLVAAVLIVTAARYKPASANVVDGRAQGTTETSAEYVPPPEPSPQFVRLTSDFTLVDFKGREVKTLDPGKRLRVIERHQHDITVDYLGEHYSIPTAITEPSK